MEARKRRKAIITSHRSGASGSVVPAEHQTTTTSAITTTTTSSTTEPSMDEAATAAALAEASTPLMEAAVIAAVTAVVDALENADNDDTPTTAGTGADDATAVAVDVPMDNITHSSIDDPTEAVACQVETLAADTLEEADEAAETNEPVGGCDPVASEEGATEGNDEARLVHESLSKGNETLDANIEEEPPKPAEHLAEHLGEDDSDSDDSSSDTGKRKGDMVVTTKPNINGKSRKTQICYEPSMPMSKDQLAAWRREARRVRNRESAAASRQRIRSRITELEDEVSDWKDKYNAAMDQLQELQEQQQHAPGHVNNNNAETGTLA